MFDISTKIRQNI